MKLISRIAACCFVLAVLVGCASNIVTSRQEYRGEKLAQPNRILIYDFAATAADMPADSAVAGQYGEHHSTPQTKEQIAVGRQMGARLAEVLVEEIRGMGLPAERASSRTSLQTGDYVLRGYLLSIDEGSAAKRVAIGFGSGASELKTMVEGYQMTDHGLRKLGSGTTDTSGGKSPGTAVALAGAVATANPAGLVVSSGMKIYGEASGSSKIEGRAEETAKEIAKLLKVKFKEQGWI